jgi:D-sedoheptulose 7-phosphate isomerase
MQKFGYFSPQVVSTFYRNPPMQQYLSQYIQAQKAALDSIPLDQVESLIGKLRQLWQEDRQLFVFGNGGSAANASHFITDLGKGASDQLSKRFRCLSLNDNMSWMTALGNDYSYDEIYARQLANFARPGDLVLTMSVSGSSPNLVKAVEWARQHGVYTVALVGGSGAAWPTWPTLSLPLTLRTTAGSKTPTWASATCSATLLWNATNSKAREFGSLRVREFRSRIVMGYSFPTLRTERFTLRRIGPADKPRGFEGLSHPEVIRYYGVSYRTLEDTQEQLDWYDSLLESQLGIWWGICYPADPDRLIGACGFNEWHRAHNRTEVGYWLLPDHWGQGHHAECLKVIIRYAFSTCTCTGLWPWWNRPTTTAPSSRRSWAFATKAPTASANSKTAPTLTSTSTHCCGGNLGVRELESLRITVALG